MKCLLDMDGVLADFVSGMCLAHKRPDPYHDPKNLGVWDLDEIFQMHQFLKNCSKLVFDNLLA